MLKCTSSNGSSSRKQINTENGLFVVNLDTKNRTNDAIVTIFAANRLACRSEIDAPLTQHAIMCAVILFGFAVELIFSLYKNKLLTATSVLKLDKLIINKSTFYNYIINNNTVKYI